jgi:hypothetical protein
MRNNNDHLKRDSYLKVSRSIFDNYKNLGYSYKGNIFRNSISSLFYLDDRKIRILNEMEKMIYFLIEKVKNIKKARNYAIDKDSSNIN